MSHRRRLTLDRLTKALRSETAEKLLIASLLILVIAFSSGLTYSLTTEISIPIAFLERGSVRIFLWSILHQSHAETVLVFIYYAMGFAALLLYIRAVSRPSDPRTTKYMLFFSFLLLLLASLGLYNGFVEKFMGPS